MIILPQYLNAATGADHDQRQTSFNLSGIYPLFNTTNFRRVGEILPAMFVIADNG